MFDCIAIACGIRLTCKQENLALARITIRNLDDEVKTRLRVRAAQHHRSMEEEARLILGRRGGVQGGYAEPCEHRAGISGRTTAWTWRCRLAGMAANRRLSTEPPAMSVLLDTSVVSELLRKVPDPAVETWAAGHALEELFFSAVGEAELRYGAALLPTGRRRESLVSDIEAMLRDALRRPSAAVRQQGGPRLCGDPGLLTQARGRSETAAPGSSRAPEDDADFRTPCRVCARDPVPSRASTSSIPGRRHERNDGSLRSGPDRRPAEGRGLEPDRRFERTVRTCAAERHAGRLCALRPPGPRPMETLGAPCPANLVARCSCVLLFVGPVMTWRVGACHGLFENLQIFDFQGFLVRPPGFEPGTY